MARFRTGVVLAAVTVLAGFAVAGCSDEQTPTTTTTQSAGPAVSNAADGVAEAQKIVDQIGRASCRERV